jgi:hypothetical protein
MGRRLAKSDIDFHRRHYTPFMAAGFVVLCMLSVLACAQIQKDEAPVPISSQQPPPPWRTQFSPPSHCRQMMASPGASREALWL